MLVVPIHTSDLFVKHLAIHISTLLSLLLGDPVHHVIDLLYISWLRPVGGCQLQEVHKPCNVIDIYKLQNGSFELGIFICLQV